MSIDAFEEFGTDERVLVPATGSGGMSGRTYCYHEPAEDGSVRASCGNMTTDGQLVSRPYVEARGIDACRRCFGGGTR